MKRIAHEVSIDQRTVKQWITAGAFPERAPRARGPTPLDEHREYIEARIAQGCHSPRLLWLELRARGYTGSRGTVHDCVVRLMSPVGKEPLVQASVRTMACPSVRRVFGWLAGWKKLNPDKTQGDEHERFIQELCKLEPKVGVVRSVTREFLGLMHRRRPGQFDRWLKKLENCGVSELQRFAASLRADLPAVRAAFTLPWSNG